MNHRVRHMKGKSFLQKTLGLWLQGAVRRQILAEPPTRDLPGKPLTVSSVSENTREGQRDCLFQLCMASPESSFHYVYSHCFVSSREPTGQREGRQDLRRSECQCVCWKLVVPEGRSCGRQVWGLSSLELRGR